MTHTHIQHLHWSTYQPSCTLVIYSQTSLGWLTRSEGIRLTPASPTLPYFSSSSSAAPPWASYLTPLPTIPGGENFVEWMAPDRGLRGRNVSLALEGSHPPEQWRTAQSLLINHCQGCPGPGPQQPLIPGPFLYSSLLHSPQRFTHCLLLDHILTDIKVPVL